jgi:SpoVK/Ycf46/Vps4 family AAA+-type ATPase
MIVQLLGKSIEDRSGLRTAFLSQGQLSSNHLITLHDTRASNTASILEKAVVLEERVLNYLLGSDDVDARLITLLRLSKPKSGLSELFLPPDVKARLHNLIQGKVQNSGAVFYLEGPYGSGKLATAEAVCGELEVPLLIIDVRQIISADLPVSLTVQLILREALLQKAYIYFDHYDLLLADDRNMESYHRNILDVLGCYPGIVFLGSQIVWEPPGGLFDRPLVKIKLTVPPFSVRKQLWESYFSEYHTIAPDMDIDALANKFRFTQGQIRDVLAVAKNLTLGREDESQITIEDLYQACRTQSNQKLSAMARKIQPKFNWRDIVLPHDQIMQLHEITNQVRQKYIVYDNWSFGKKLAPSMGLNILFAGPSGTGKTMAAQIMANELALDLYKIDLATVVSKYIGETEKNLDRIFEEAQDSNAILFFDEADAIFGKRSEVKDSHDRYANIEIAYLLQRMEEYDGIVILATNLRKNLDDAFARRMHFCVEFPLPEERDRYQIWQRVFPEEAPVSDDIDINFMARQFKITGGNIKNIVLGAAFMAAGDGGIINIEHLIKATKREYQKIGRLCTETDFADYFDLVKS